MLDAIEELERELAQARDKALEEAAVQTGMFHMFVKVGPPPRLEYLGFDHEKARLTILALRSPQVRAEVKTS